MVILANKLKTNELRQRHVFVAAAIFLACTGHPKEIIKEYIEKDFGYDLSRHADDIRKDYKFEILCEKSVPEAIICWLQSDTYEQAVRNAIFLGGDADTQATIAGAIAAATPSMEIPQNIADIAFSMLTDELKEIVVAFNSYIIRYRQPIRKHSKDTLRRGSCKTVPPQCVKKLTCHLDFAYVLCIIDNIGDLVPPVAVFWYR